MISLLTAAFAALLAPSGTAAFDAQMQPLAAQYISIQEALAADHNKGVQEAAKAIAAGAKKLDPKTVTGEHATHYAGLPEKIAAAGEALAKETDIKAQREALKKLSQPFAMWATMSKPKGIDVVFCSMAKGSWLQKAGEIRNPYYGASMLKCGSVVGGENVGKKGGHMAH